MHYDPDLSAVVTRRISPLFGKPLQNTLNRKADLLHISPSSADSNKPNDFEFNDITVKKRKLLNQEAFAIQKNMEQKGSKETFDVYSMLLNDAKKFEERVNVNDSVLITTFSKAIFRYAIFELSRESEHHAFSEPGLSLFRPFASKYYGKINSLEDIKWIWSMSEGEGMWMTTCKKIYKEFSTRFFSNESIMMKWIDNKLIREVVQKIYSKYRDFFGQSLNAPELFRFLTPMISASRF